MSKIINVILMSLILTIMSFLKFSFSCQKWGWIYLQWKFSWSISQKTWIIGQSCFFIQEKSWIGIHQSFASDPLSHVDLLITAWLLLLLGIWISLRNFERTGAKVRVGIFGAEIVFNGIWKFCLSQLSLWDNAKITIMVVCSRNMAGLKKF